MLENKLGITNSVELSKEEEKITKLKALKLFDTNKIEEYEIGTFKGLSDIHKFLFDDIYFFAGKIRKENIAKGNFRFASCMYLEDVLNKIDKMPQHTFEEIVQKYIEMNIAHPFREGNGRTTREFLRQLSLKNGYILNLHKVAPQDLLNASIRSIIDTSDLEKYLYECLETAD